MAADYTPARYRVIYNRTRQDWYSQWESSDDREQAERIAAALARVPGVISAYVYDTHERTRFADYAEPIEGTRPGDQS